MPPDDARTEWFVERGLPVSQVRRWSAISNHGANFFDIIESPKYRSSRPGSMPTVAARTRGTPDACRLAADGAPSALAASPTSDQVDRYGVLWSYDAPPTDAHRRRRHPAGMASWLARKLAVLVNEVNSGLPLPMAVVVLRNALLLALLAVAVVRIARLAREPEVVPARATAPAREPALVPVHLS